MKATTTTFLLLVGVLGNHCPAAERPNVVLLVADDHGYADLSAFRHAAKDVKTPNLDRLAGRGVLFTNGYASACICSPSRCGLITGRYQQRWGVHWYNSSKLPENEVTLPTLLKQSGYVTGKVGKTHYGRNDADSFHFPLRHGFNHFYGFMHATKHYLRHTAADAKLFQGGNLDAGPMWIDRKRKDQQGYSTKLFEQAALDFIDRNKDKPFYLQVSFNAVHLFVNQLPNADLKQAGIPPQPDWDPNKEPGRKGYVAWYYRHLKRNGDDAKPHDPHGRQRYQICLAYLDRAVGAILDKLSEHKLDRNTLIVYLSDNGGSPRTYANNKPLRGYKYGLYEGGIRVPFMVSWPGQVPQGKVSADPVGALDVLPTVAAAARVDLPENLQLDGQNLLPIMQGKKPLPKDRTLFWTAGRDEKKRSYAVRQGKWKLLNSPEADLSLYDLSKDVGERDDVAAKNQDTVKRLQRKYQDWRKQIAN